MQVHPTEDQPAFLREAVDGGRYRDVADALQSALLLLEGKERLRVEILAAVDQAEASIAKGEGRRISSYDDAVRLADDVKQRGRALLAQQPRP
jgi:Arc/MetJ-type ribon-helix-helix transcriptional regulator